MVLAFLNTNPETAFWRCPSNLLEEGIWIQFLYTIGSVDRRGCHSKHIAEMYEGSPMSTNCFSSA